MSSESEQIKTEDENQIIRKDGLRLFGYSIPWTVVLIVALLLLYIAYKNGQLDGLLSEIQYNKPKVVSTGPFIDVGSPVGPPSEIQEMINRYKYEKSRMW